MGDKRQKNQLKLAFMVEDTGEALRAATEGSESLTAKCRAESPAIAERLMEEVCERENCKQALARGQQREPGRGRNECSRSPGPFEAALASNPETAAERDLQAATGEAGGNPEAGRGGAKAWHPDSAGSIYPAGGDAGAATQMGRDVLQSQLRVSTWTLGASGG
jgi:hypothetical protein